MIEEDLDSFLADHGVECMAGTNKFMAIKDQPDVEVDVGKMRTTSTMYTLLAKTADVVANNLRNGSEITIGGIRFGVREPELLDDGAFTQLNVTKK